MDPTASVDAFCAVPLEGLDEAALQARAVLARGLAQRLLGTADQALAALVGSEEAQAATHAWWRDSAVRTGQQAGADVRRAAVLRDLPLLADAVTRGLLSQEQVAVLCRLHGRLPLDDLQLSQAGLVAVAQGMNTDALARWVAHQVATHSEPALEEDQERARQRRYLQLRHEPDGSVRGTFVLAGEDAEAVLTVLEPLARKQGDDDERTIGQRRADALVDVFVGAAAWMDLPAAGGQRPQLSYVMTSEWCAGTAQPRLSETIVGAGADVPSLLHPLALARHAPDGAWTGPPTRARLEAVLCDARISRMLLDPHGTVVSLESLTGAITPAQRKAVSTRDRHCVARGCTRPPAFCDVHHLTARKDGGASTVDNLVLMCRRHHVLWHRGEIGLEDLHVPWRVCQERREEGPWDGHSPPMIA
jgi:hypothetical protein